MVQLLLGDSSGRVVLQDALERPPVRLRGRGHALANDPARARPIRPHRDALFDGLVSRARDCAQK